MKPTLRWLVGRSAFQDSLIIFLVVFGFYWKLTLTDQFTVWDNPDGAKQILPWMAFEARQFQSAHPPLWDPHSWGGQSLIGQGQPGVCFPLNWFLFIFGFRNQSLRAVIHWANLYYVSIHFLGALFMYALARELGRSRFASILAGFAFTASAYMGTVIWPQKLNGAIWAPLVFLFFIRVWRGQEPVRNAAFSGACLGAAFLSGHHEAPLYTGFAIASCWGWILWEALREKRVIPMLVALATFGILAVLVSAVQVIPEIQYGRLAIRWLNATAFVNWNQKVPYSIHSDLSLGARSLIGVVVPWFSERHPPFLGWAFLALSAIGLVQFWSSREVKLFFTVGVGGLLFALGKNNTLHGIIYSLAPMAEKARFAELAILLFGLAAAVLLAYGVDGLWAFGLENRQWIRRALHVLLGAAIFLASCTVFVFAFGSKTVDPNFLTLSGFSGLCCAGILYAAWNDSIRPRTARILLALLIALELGNVAPPAFTSSDQGWKFLDPLAKYSDIAEFLKRQNEGMRLDADSALIPFNFGDWYGVDTFNAYLASVTQNVFWLYTQDSHWCQMLFATGYYAGTKPKTPNQIPVFTSRDGLTVYRSPDAMPRAWIAHQVTTVSQQEGARRIQGGTTLRDEVFTFGKAPKLETCASQDQARLISAGVNREIISVEASCRSLLVDADTDYPGWHASIDGSPVPIIEVYGALRAVEIPRGRHTVIFQYRPLSVIIGFILSIIGLGVVGWFAISDLRRHRTISIADKEA